MPHRLRGEGLFMAVVRKPDAEVGSARTKSARSKSKPNPKLPQEVLRWLSPELRADVTLQSLPDGTLTAIPRLCIPSSKRSKGRRFPFLLRVFLWLKSRGVLLTVSSSRSKRGAG